MRKVAGADRAKLFAMKVLKKACIVVGDHVAPHHMMYVTPSQQSRKTTEHTIAERNILASIHEVHAIDSTVLIDR